MLNFIYKLFNTSFRARCKYVEAVRELSAMSDRDLADIGIRRGDIEYIASAAAREYKDTK